MPGWGWFGDEDAPDATRDVAIANSLLLTDHVQELVVAALEKGPARPRVTPETICGMHAIAMRSLLASAGAYRHGPATIENSKHVPPDHTDVPALVTDMCTTIEDRAGDDPVWLASFALWRLNWIHPFEDGNGRTARAITQYLLAVLLQLRTFPGSRSLPDRILDEKLRYWRCLEEADNAFERGRVDVSHMAGFIDKHLRRLLKEGTGA